MSKFIKIGDVILNTDNIAHVAKLQYEKRDEYFVSLAQKHRIDMYLSVDSSGLWEVSKLSKSVVIARHIDVDKFFDWITDVLMDTPDTCTEFLFP